MFSLRMPKSQETPWPSLYRGQSIIVDRIGTCVVEAHIDGTTYQVSDSEGNFHDVMPTPIFVWNKVQTMDGGADEHTPREGSGETP